MGLAAVGGAGREPIAWRRLDLRLVGTVAALCLLGLLLQRSVHEAALPGSPEGRTDFALRQLRWFGVGTVAGAFLLLVPYRRLLDFAYVFYGAGVLLLVAVLFAGTAVNGARRWIDLGSLALQPSEPMKVGLVLVLARHIRFRDDRKTFKGLAIPFALTAVPMALILREPDLGTALLLVPVLFAVLYAAGARPAHLGAVVLMGIAASPVVYFGVLQDYQRERVTAFLVHHDGSLGRRERERDSWQAVQSRTAVASGGLGGLGLSQGIQNRNGAVPEHHTDFIFTVLAEEIGFLGVALLVGLYGMLFLFLAGVAVRCRDPAGKLLVTGVLVLLATQAFVNLAMTVGLFPITGVPLPFLSYGGSSVLTSFAAVALALNVAARPGFDFGPADFD